MNDTKHDGGSDDDTDIAALLEAAGSREELPDELRDRWEAHFRSELKPAVDSGRRGFLIPLVSLAASFVVLVLVLDFFAGEPVASTSMQLQAVSGEGRLVIEPGRELAAVAGQNLAPGVVLESSVDGRIALFWAGFDVRLNGRTRLKLHNDHLELLQGEMYASNRNRRITRQHITVKTPFALIRDIGTQFKVRLTEERVYASVRQGSIVVKTPAGEHRADALPANARTLVISASSTVQTIDDDSDWEWIYPVARTFKLQGASVFQFLRWSSNETGRELVFADEDVALAARNARLSGNVDMGGMTPDLAVPIVLSTTRFEVTTRADGSLLVTRRSE